jgi:hypothetical protein
MNDDWRVQVLLGGKQVVDQWHELGKARELERELSSTFQDRVIVSRDDACVFVYSGDQAQAERTRAWVEGQAQEHGWRVESDLTHWNHESLEWEPAGMRSSESEEEDIPAPSPSDEAQAPIATEPEKAQAEEQGHPDFEVRVNLPSRQDASRLADRLRAEGIPCVRRWRHVVLGAPDEESAQELADRIRLEAPIGSQVMAEEA